MAANRGELARFSTKFGDVDMKEADGVLLELLSAHAFPRLDVRQTADTMPLEAAVQRRTGKEPRQRDREFLELCQAVACEVQRLRFG